MIRSRIKKDLSLRWSIFATDGTTRAPYSPDEDSVVMLITPYNRIKIDNAQIVGNEVRWTFEGRQQKYPGIYSLELIENDGQKGMLTVDSCKAFELVEHTCEESLDSDGAIQVQTVLLESTVVMSYDDIALWKELENKVDKVEGFGLSEENYTAEEKEKLAGLQNYDDTAVKEELVRLEKDKADKTAIPTKVSELENDADYVTPDSFKTINGEPIVGEGDIVIQGGGGGSSEPSDILNALYKRGVVSHTLGSQGSPATGYRIVTSDTINGIIPQSFIDEVEAKYGVTFNAETGYFEYDDITNLSYEDVRLSIASCSDFLTKGIYSIDDDLILYHVFGADDKAEDRKVRLVLVPRALLTETNISNIPFRWWLTAHKSMFRLEIVNNIRNIPLAASVAKLFNCQFLRKAGYYNFTGVVYNQANFDYNYSLEEVWIKSLGFNLSIAQSPLLKNECILYMIQNSTKTGITITLHPTAYDRAMADAEIVAAMESKQVNLAKA